MAWNTTNEGVPYHPLVAPEVPVAPQIQAVGTDIGSSIVSAFVHRAIAAEQTNLDQQKLLQNADLAAKGLQLDAQKQQQTYEVAKENADSLEQYRSDEQAWHEKNYSERQTALKTAQESKQAQQDAIVANVTSMNDLDKQSYVDGKDNGLFDDKLLTSDPGEYIMRAKDFKDKYGLAQQGATPKLIADVSKRAGSITVPYAPGAELVDPTGKSTGKDLAWRVPVQASDGSTKYVDAATQAKPTPLLSIYNQYQTDPRGVEKALIAAGHGSIKHETTATGKQATPVLDEWATKLTKAFSKKQGTVTSQVPRGLMSVHPEWQVKAGAGQPDTTGADTSSNDDVSNYKAAMAANPDQADYINSVWAQKHPDQPPPQ